MKLSVIVPVYNEQATLAEIIQRVLATSFEKEVVIVDDGSTDGTRGILQKFQSIPNVRILYHETNRGKGAAIITGLECVRGEYTLIQDADLEYDPNDYAVLMEPFQDNAVQVVYGSRNLKKNKRSSWAFYWGGRVLSWVTSVLYGVKITDEPTGYKIFRTSLLKTLDLRSTGFEFCPEVTAKILRRKIPIREVPISYNPRNWSEGKKIHWQDGFEAVWVLIRYRFKRL